MLGTKRGLAETADPHNTCTLCTTCTQIDPSTLRDRELNKTRIPQQNNQQKKFVLKPSSLLLKHTQEQSVPVFTHTRTHTTHTHNTH